MRPVGQVGQVGQVEQVEQVGQGFAWGPSSGLFGAFGYEGRSGLSWSKWGKWPDLESPLTPILSTIDYSITLNYCSYYVQFVFPGFSFAINNNYYVYYKH